MADVGLLDDAMLDIEAINGTLRRLAPNGVRVSARLVAENDVRAMWPAEHAAMASASPGRRREFASGRALLRLLIGAEVAFPPSPSRRPAVPDGWVATLAHDSRVVVAAVAATSHASALGIDVEPVATIEPDVADVVVRPDDRVPNPLVAFVLKEAAYKAWSGTGGRMLEHHDVLVDAAVPHPAGADFTATVVPDGVAIHGRYASTAQVWLALAVIPAL